MNNTLYNQFACRYYEENQRIENALFLLRQTLNPDQKKLLLSIIDDKDLIREKSILSSYAHGFQSGAKVMLENLSLEF